MNGESVQKRVKVGVGGESSSDLKHDLIDPGSGSRPSCSSPPPAKKKRVLVDEKGCPSLKTKFSKSAADDPDSIGLSSEQISAVLNTSCKKLTTTDSQEDLEDDAMLKELKEWHDWYWSTKVLKIVLNNECLGKKATLKCRRVCRSWNQIILDYLQQHPSHQALNCSNNIGLRYYSIQAQEPWQTKLQKNWFTPDDTPKRLEKLEAYYYPDKNPYLSRAITLSNRKLGPGCRQWAPEQLVMLHYYGLHVWHCTFEIHPRVTLCRSPDSYKFLVSCLMLLPNLRTLRVVYLPHPAAVGWKEEQTVYEWPAEAMLINLRHLTFLGVVNLPYPIFNAIISTVPKDALKKLQISSSSTLSDNCFTVDVENYDLESWPNLTDASLKLQKYGFRKLEEMGTLWPLKKLYLNLDLGWSLDNNCPRRMQWSRVFHFLGNKFGPTLTHLGLVLPGACKFKDKDRNDLLEASLSYRLNLWHLKELRIEVSNITSLDFLLPMSDTLEVLFLHFSCIDYSTIDEVRRSLRSKQVIKIDPTKVFSEGGCSVSRIEDKDKVSSSSVNLNLANDSSFVEEDEQDHPLNSNIWKLFKKLERLTFQFSSCFEVVDGNRMHLGGSSEAIKSVYVRRHSKIISLN